MILGLSVGYQSTQLTNTINTFECFKIINYAANVYSVLTRKLTLITISDLSRFYVDLTRNVPSSVR